MVHRFFLILTTLAFGLLASCAPQTPPQTPAASVPAAPIYTTSFICQDGNTPVQDAVCGNQQLAALDVQMAGLIRQHIGTDSIFGRDRIMAAQRAWLLGLPAACSVTSTANPEAISCLISAYQAQIATMANWPAPQNTGDGSEAGAIAHYVQYRLADAKQPALCATISAAAAGALATDGTIDPSRLAGAQEVAGTHGTASGTAPQGFGISVDVHRSGLYGGYQTRASTVSVAGAASPLLGPSSLGAYVGTLPNGGGRFGNFASQTDDYGAVDVFTLNAQLVALLSDVIGYNSPAPPGETADAALFTLSQTTATPACLFQTYTTPPPLTQGTFSEQISLTPLLALIDTIKGAPPASLAQSDLQDTVYVTAETRWKMFNMPLVVVAENRDGGWTGFLRSRHDQVLDTLFTWSHQSAANQAEFTQLFQLLRPAAVDLDTIYVQQQGLSATDAEQATSLAMMELLWQATEYMAPGLGSGHADPVSYQSYKPRYPILANPQD